MTTELQRAKAAALQDQVWASLRDKWTDLERIAAKGPSDTEFDTLLIRMVFNHVLGGLSLREYDRRTLEATP